STRTALFKNNNDDDGRPDPRHVYSYHGYHQDPGSTVFWHWFHRHSDGEAFTLALEDTQDYDEDEYDLLDAPENMEGTFGIYSWANTSGGEETAAALQGHPWTETEIFSRTRDFILKRVPLRHYPSMFDIEWTHPLQYTPHRHEPSPTENAAMAMQLADVTLTLSVRFEYHPAGCTRVVQGVKRNRRPHGAIAGGRGTFLVLGDTARFLMVFPDNPEIPPVDLYPFMTEAKTKRYSCRIFLSLWRWSAGILVEHV
ncbi:MAG: hypothetical protein KIY12_04255, partial [Thermoplasmata archaeon]|nr:hypothetical protein [Candidatus Sysuiplasma superficiale]